MKRKTRATAQHSRERGFALIATAFGLIAILGVAGLSMDLGRMYIAKNELMAYSDAASIAAALQLDGTAAAAHVRTRLSACPSWTVQVKTSTSACGNGAPLRARIVAAGRGAKPFGHGTSVYRDSPVVVEKAKNSLPAGPSESKSMISRCRFSGVADFAASSDSYVSAGAGVEIGSKPRFRMAQCRVMIMMRPAPLW